MVNAAHETLYRPLRLPQQHFINVRHLTVHFYQWGERAAITAARPAVVLLHGWMDVGASFQFLVDALAADRYVIAPDWRGFGQTSGAPTDHYWYGDYLADLDGLLNALSLATPEQPIDLVGHSMGGNIAMLYAGICPQRIRTLVNLEGFGLPKSRAEDAPSRYASWLRQLQHTTPLRDYASLAEVADRLQKNNARLRRDRALWLAQHWARYVESSGKWVINADPAHKRFGPQLYRVDEVLACWAQIQAPVLMLEAASDERQKWWGEAYPPAEFADRLAVVPRVTVERIENAGHMLQHDQPEHLARLLEHFWDHPDCVPGVVAQA